MGQIYYIIMQNLDSSLHSLNTSSSKYKYSFSQSRRFQQSFKPLCDSIYDLPSYMSKKSAMLGYGQKTSPLDNKGLIPGVGMYQIESSINPVKNRGKSISFGVSREKMEFGDPLSNIKYLKNIPSPSSYEPKNTRETKGPTLQSRYKDYNFEKTINNPGPGAYNHDELGLKNYYALSKNKHVGISRIAKSPRLDPIQNGKNLVGPTDYQPTDDLNNKGRYLLGMHANTNSCIFGNSSRKGFVQKDLAKFPGPGQYNSFSSFG